MLGLIEQCVSALTGADEYLFLSPLVFQSAWKMPLDKLLMMIPTPQTESQRKRVERMSITMR